MIVMWFYFFEIHSKIAAWCKQHIPFIDKISEMAEKSAKGGLKKYGLQKCCVFF